MMILHMKNKVRNKSRSPPPSLLFKGQGTEHTTVKWPNCSFYLYCFNVFDCERFITASVKSHKSGREPRLACANLQGTPQPFKQERSGIRYRRCYGKIGDFEQSTLRGKSLLKMNKVVVKKD